MTVYCCLCGEPVPEPGLWLVPVGDVCSQECGHQHRGVFPRSLFSLHDDHVCNVVCTPSTETAYVWTAGTPALGLAS